MLMCSGILTNVFLVLDRLTCLGIQAYWSEEDMLMCLDIPTDVLMVYN